MRTHVPATICSSGFNEADDRRRWRDDDVSSPFDDYVLAAAFRRVDVSRGIDR